MFHRKIKFSIIMPTFNRAFIISDAIDSALNQTYQDFELIIVDDGSDDNTEQLIAEKYAAELTEGKIVYKRIPNSGVCRARNVGLSIAKNEWIAFLDSDNKLLPDFLETFRDAIYKNPRAKFFYAKIQHRGSGHLCGESFCYEKLAGENYIDLGAVVFNKKLYIKLGGFDEDLTRLVDWDLILTYTKKLTPPPVFIDKVVVDYNDDESFSRISITGTYENARDIVYKKRTISTSECAPKIVRQYPKWMINLLCVFIPNRKNRHKVRKKYTLKGEPCQW